MLFAWVGFLKSDQSVPQEVNQLVSAFVEQPYIDIKSFGPLCDEDGKRAAMMMIFEVEDRAKAQSFVDSSPFLKAGLYERHHLYEYRNEGG
ncbi:MAG TPA: YciI family protein [Sphingomicrobium sp.]|jgi:uncharacterized protein YciI